MNGVASQHSQPQSLLNTLTISGPDHTSGAGFTTTLNQQAPQHSQHHDSTSPNDTNQTSDSPPPSDLESLTTTVGETDALVPKLHPLGDEDGEGQPIVIKEGGEVLRGTDSSPVELSQDAPEPNVGSGDAEVMVNDSDAQDWIPEADHELKRVKVCELSTSVIYQSIYQNNAMFSGKIASFCSNYSLLLRYTNLSAHGGWIKGQRFALASFKKKRMKPFLSPVQKGIITTSYFQLLFVQTMFISGNKVSSAFCLSCCLQSPAHAHLDTRSSCLVCYSGFNL